ncbi:MAG: acyl carrier protein [Xanthomonadales bacterium]|nr:acyl carrier protein [Xanthomonadales bacterium]
MTAPTNYSKDELYQRIKSILQNTFDIDAAQITLDAQLGDDLDIDSIDAVDLIVQLKPIMGGNLKPEAFKSVRTVQDVVDALDQMQRANA